jgi:hypothetical protein
MKIEPCDKVGEHGKLLRVTYHTTPPHFWGKQMIKQVKIVGHAEDLERALATADAFAVHQIGYERSKRLVRTKIGG